MKKKKLPRKPKATASLSAWKNWEERCKDVEKHNKQMEADKKAKEVLIKKTRSLKMKSRVKGKLPKASSSLQTWKNAFERINEAAKEKAKKEAIMKKHR